MRIENIAKVGIIIALVAVIEKCFLFDNTPPPESETIALVGGFVIDGTGSEGIPNATVIIENTHIVFVGNDSNYTIPANAHVIDATGLSILPGLINTHIHNGYTESNLKAWAQAGVTTVRDLGLLNQSLQGAYTTRNELNKNHFNARLVAAGPLVTTPGGYGSFEVSSESDARSKTNYLIDSGADIIKIALEDDLQGRTWPMLSQAEIAAIVVTAHSNNIPVSAHISRAAHLDIAIKTDVDDVAHMIVNTLPDSLITQMINKNIYWVPTLELWQGVSDRYSINWDDTASNNLNRFVQAGGKVALGTDYDGYVTDFDLGLPVHEIELMELAGMSALDIIVASTKNAAHVCNLEDELGTLEAGKIADVVILGANPLEDLNALSDVYMVIRSGTIIRGD